MVSGRGRRGALTQAAPRFMGVHDMGKPVLGAQLYTVRNCTQTVADIRETFRRVKDIGYTAAQISGFGPVDPAELDRAVRDSGLIIEATHVAWDRFLKDLDGLIDQHRRWGCVHPAIGGLPPEYFTAEGLDRFIRELAPVAERLAAAGMDFSYHNHHHESARCGRRSWLDQL